MQMVLMSQLYYYHLHLAANEIKGQPFASGLPSVDKFPFKLWARIAARIYRNPPSEILGYGDPQGYGPLREAVAAYLIRHAA